MPRRAMSRRARGRDECRDARRRGRDECRDGALRARGAPAPAEEEEDDDDGAPAWLRPPSPPPPDSPTTSVRCDDGVVLRLEGVLPPRQLQHLARQNTALLARDGRLVVAHRRGADVMLGTHRVVLESYRDRAYDGHPRAAAPAGGAPPRRAGALMEAVRRRRRELERR